MASISDIRNEWRDALKPASFRGEVFHVEGSGRQSGRRTVSHEYPKRNKPYAEDMGRHAVRWNFVGYILLNDHRLQVSASTHGKNPRNTVAQYGNLLQQRDRLIEALEKDGPGMLVHPSLHTYKGLGDESPSGAMMVMCERYSISESRQKGGYYELDMTFVEAGAAPKPIQVDTQGNLNTAAGAANTAAKNAIDEETSYLQNEPKADFPFVRAPGYTAE